jgi:hypothetical protein
VNTQPNAVKKSRTFGDTRTVCLRRNYCSPCTADFDCPTIDGKASRCVDDSAGGKFCATQCVNTTNCNLDAQCSTYDDGTKLCIPRAGVCKGDGSLCSPCRSDADCPNGFCIKSFYSPETFCSVKSKTACVASGTASLVKGDCPPFTAVSTTKIGCEADKTDPEIPKDQCVGIIPFADSGDIGCWTKH